MKYTSNRDLQDHYGYQIRSLLEERQSIGVNHATLGIQYSKRPAADALQEFAEEVLPLFPTYGDWEPNQVYY